jgi:hypothetical protein
MCTVSYIPKKSAGGFVLTSNRDEKEFRTTVPPLLYEQGTTKLVFPKDEKAGGSWIAANNNGRICCLLNGAFVVHEKKSKYLQSRGNILVELASSPKTPELYFTEKDLSEVEPFTIILIEKMESEISHFSEFIWDGAIKYFRMLNSKNPHIWSSVTLYNEEHRNLRRQWFNQFITENNGSISSEIIIQFHAGTHTFNKSINMLMEREGGLKTVSITQVVPENGKFRMDYFDLNNRQNTSIKI